MQIGIKDCQVDDHIQAGPQTKGLSKTLQEQYEGGWMALELQMHKHVDNRVTKCRNMLNGVEYAFVVVIAVSI